MPAEEVPLLQKDLIHKANSLGIPIITATQMLDSMASSPAYRAEEVTWPTRFLMELVGDAVQ